MKCSLMCVVLASTPVVAQGLHVAPPAYRLVDAPAQALAAGIGATERQQILIDQVHLAPLVGRELLGLSFRRNHAPEPLAATTGQLEVRLGIAPHGSGRAQPTFAQNLPAPTLVFRGIVQAPLSSDPTMRPVGWTSEDVVEITFSQGFVYGGGTLCIDIDGTGTTGWWPVDAAEDPITGAVLREGTACGPRAAVLGETASVAAADLVVGRTTIFKLFGEPGHAAFLLLGLGTFGQPLDLALVGAPGCELRVDAFVALPTTLTPTAVEPELGAVANVQLHLPANPALMGASFIAQFAELGGASLATSNTLRCQIAPSASTTGTAMVWQQPGRPPVVHFRRVPIVGLRWR